ADPEGTLRRICEHIELDYSARMLDYHERATDRLRELAKPLAAEGEKRGLSAESRLEAHAMTAEPPRTYRSGRWRTEMPPAELATLRRRGVLVIGRFVWEHFTADDVPGARQAYDVVYSFTRCEQERYRSFGLETPYVPWGIHPELLAVESLPRDDGFVQVIFPGGFVGHRKPIEPVVEAFKRTRDRRLRLLVKAQVERKGGADAARSAAAADDRITFMLS